MDAVERTATFVDRTGWASGEWDQEPDRVEFRAHGYPCLALRGERHGAWCGYVGLPATHPWAQLDACSNGEANAHGGLTYGPAPCMTDDETPSGHGRICHVPAPGESDDVRWIGFDCVHAADFAPGTESRERAIAEQLRAAGNEEHARLFDNYADGLFGRARRYCTLAYVRAEIVSLAEQARAIDATEGR